MKFTYMPYPTSLYQIWVETHLLRGGGIAFREQSDTSQLLKLYKGESSENI